MTRHLFAAALALTAIAAPAYAADTKYSTAETSIGTLLDNAETKAVLDKYIPTFASNPQIAMARSMTLKAIQGFAGDVLNDAVLAKIDADLAKVPVK
jgi:para-nitrobenzyl esterase